MQKRRLVWLALATGVGLLAGVYAAWVALQPSRVTRENYARVMSNMSKTGEPVTERKVAAVMGAGSEPQDPQEVRRHFGEVRTGSSVKEWDGPDFRTLMYFGADGNLVTSVQIGQTPPPTLFERVRTWLGL
jgi:hypothetical protein